MTDATLDHVTGHVDEHEHGHAVPDAEQISNSKMAMWLYLASEVVIFSTLIAVYAVFRLNNGDIVLDVQNELGLALVSLNTFLLLSSSWAMVMGLREVQLNNTKGFIRWIGLTAVLGATFVGLQGVEYTELAHAGLSISTEWGMRFYAPTAFHGAHVIIGVLWALRLIWRGRHGRYNAKNFLAVEIFGLYWHFVDVVWLFLFTIIYLM